MFFIDRSCLHHFEVYSIIYFFSIRLIHFINLQHYISNELLVFYLPYHLCPLFHTRISLHFMHTFWQFCFLVLRCLVFKVISLFVLLFFSTLRVGWFLEYFYYQIWFRIIDLSFYVLDVILDYLRIDLVL